MVYQDLPPGTEDDRQGRRIVEIQQTEDGKVMNKQTIILKTDNGYNTIGSYNHGNRILEIADKINVDNESYKVHIVASAIYKDGQFSILIECTNEDGDIKHCIISNVCEIVQIKQLDDEEIGGTVGMDIVQWFKDEQCSIMVG